MQRYKPGMEADDQDPYQGWSDDGNADPNEQPQLHEPEPVAEEPAPPREAPAPPREEPRSSMGNAERQPSAPAPAPQKTFAQMQADGEARPPMPATAQMLTQQMVPAGTMGNGEPPRGTMGRGEPAFPASTMGRGDDVSLPRPDFREFTQGITEEGDELLPRPEIGEWTQGTETPQSDERDWLLSMLTDRAQGRDRGAVDLATERKILGQLEGSSPYGSEAVRSEYDWLAGNIDDDFTQQERALDEGMARRGLYGSGGKDFHSGRLSDLNVGRRSAKTSLAQDLANKFATTKGQYDANAINQGMAAADRETGNRRGWLDSLMGYGQQAFNNDLAAADFQQGVNESEQDFLMRMLSLGYGV